jgi:RecG-like helicase
MLRAGEHVTVMARVVQTTVRSMRNRRGALLEAVITDGRHRLSLTFFGKHRGSLYAHEQRLQPGKTGLFTGTVGLYRGERQLTHPAFMMMGEEDLDSDEDMLAQAARPIPIYPAAANVPSWKIAKAVQIVLPSAQEAIATARAAIGDEQSPATAVADTWDTSRWTITLDRDLTGRTDAQVPDVERLEVDARTGAVLARTTT